MDIEKIERSVKLSRWIVSSIFIITLASYVGWFALSQGQALSVKSGDWGAFGDFIGGLLNPLIAYSAFYWLTVSVVVQKRELAETKQALIDSSLSQEKQVKEVFRSSEINFINMQLKMISIDLEAEYAYRNSVAQSGMISGRIQAVLNMKGEKVSAQDEVILSESKILKLKVKQQELILEASQILIEED